VDRVFACEKCFQELLLSQQSFDEIILPNLYVEQFIVHIGYEDHCPIYDGVTPIMESVQGFFNTFVYAAGFIGLSFYFACMIAYFERSWKPFLAIPVVIIWCHCVIMLCSPYWMMVFLYLMRQKSRWLRPWWNTLKYLWVTPLKFCLSYDFPDTENYRDVVQSTLPPYQSDFQFQLRGLPQL